jgi:pyruvate/2-oxoglutarate dehydrogenase complex dihydrolipoamide dehydrogenase (E3) component
LGIGCCPHQRSASSNSKEIFIMEKFDAIIVGTGQAGPSLATRMVREGMKTAIIERNLFGGTCVNVGCIPTKTLVASARAAHMARRGGDFGVTIDGSITVDMKKVKARKDGVVRQSNEGVTKWMKTMEGLTVYEGHGRFHGPNAIEVNGEVLEAEKIILNVGGRAFVPDMPGINDVPYLTNSSIMDVDFLPEHLVIIGGSYIGLEFAQMYRRFGSRVTVVEQGPRLIGREDEDISAAIKGILENEGIDIRLNAGCSPTPMTWGSKKRGLKRTRAAISRSMMNCAPMCRASGR